MYILRILVILFGINLLASVTNAQTGAATSVLLSKTPQVTLSVDSSAYRRDQIQHTVRLTTERSLLDSVSETALKRMDDSSIHVLFTSLHHTVKTKKINILGPKAYYNMAVLFARLKNYPLALKFFSYAKTASEEQIGKHRNKKNVLSFPDPERALEVSFTQENMPLLQGTDTVFIENRGKKGKSRPVAVRKLLEPFHDEEEGAAYGVMLHVKQPKYGKRKPFMFINNVGHMFVTLIKFEQDGQTVSRTFGFYPRKQNFLSATPIIPATSSTFKNDSLHDWDELVGRFISYKQFKLIVHMIRQYGKKRYHLSTNNCTDFGLCISEIAGISIKNTRGSWPLGKGNDPGDTGQSLYEGLFSTIDQEDVQDIFSCTNLDKVE